MEEMLFFCKSLNGNGESFLIVTMSDDDKCTYTCKAHDIDKLAKDLSSKDEQVVWQEKGLITRFVPCVGCNMANKCQKKNSLITPTIDEIAELDHAMEALTREDFEEVTGSEYN